MNSVLAELHVALMAEGSSPPAVVVYSVMTPFSPVSVSLICPVS
ncbi:hypothetical protein [Corallococcus llansteffanensis]|nr:hypothetical protein [Corallococcus llansteffanensis]